MRSFSRFVVPGALLACAFLLAACGGSKQPPSAVLFNGAMAQFMVARKGSGDVVEVRLTPAEGSKKVDSIDIQGGEQIKTLGAKPVMLVLAQRNGLTVPGTHLLRAFSSSKPVEAGECLIPRLSDAKEPAMLDLMRHPDIAGVKQVDPAELGAFQLAVWAVQNDCHGDASTLPGQLSKKGVAVPSEFGGDYDRACKLLIEVKWDADSAKSGVAKTIKGGSNKPTPSPTYESELQAASVLLGQARDNLTDRSKAGTLLSDANEHLTRARSLGAQSPTPEEKDLSTMATTLQGQLPSGGH